MANAIEHWKTAQGGFGEGAWLAGVEVSLRTDGDGWLCYVKFQRGDKADTHWLY